MLLDRDGVINRDSSEYIKSVAEWQPLPGSLEAMAALTRAGFSLAVITNQSGVGRGLFDTAALAAIHAAMRSAVVAAGAELAGIYVCPHRPDEGCACRKPRPELLLQAMREHGGGTAVAFVGDKVADVEAARAAGIRPILVGTRVAHDELPEVERFPDLAAFAAAMLADSSPGT